jgi:DNA-directed RNA polymerase specialized sigma24 family protein
VTRDPLQELIRSELCAEILGHLEPIEAFIAWQRVRGVTDAEIAQVLAMSRRAVNRRMRRAQQRISQQVPDSAELLGGRVRQRGRPRKRQGPP